MKGKNLAWGLFFIAAAALVILNATGVLAGVGLWSLIITLLLVPIFVKSIAHISFGGIFFSLAIASIIYAEPLGIEQFVPWPVLGCALFLTIGLSIIFPHKHRFPQTEFKHDNSEDWINETVDGEHIELSTRFSGSVKYVNSDNLSDLTINCSFAGMKVYLDNATLAGETVAATVNVEFGGLEIFVPKDWTVKTDANCVFGGMDEKGLKNSPKGTKTLLLRGNAKFSGITIIYV